MTSLRYLLFAVFSVALLLTATKLQTLALCGPRPTMLDSFEASDEVATVVSNVIKLTTVQDVYEVELTLPFPWCEKIKG